MRDWCQLKVISIYYLLLIPVQYQFCEEFLEVEKEVLLILLGFLFSLKQFNQIDLHSLIEKPLNILNFVYSHYGD